MIRAPKGVYKVEGAFFRPGAPGSEVGQVAAVDQIAHNALSRTFGDTDPLGHVAQPDARIPRDAQQGMGVVGEERPLGHWGIVPPTSPFGSVYRPDASNPP